MSTQVERDWRRRRKAIAKLRAELRAVLTVAIARGEVLGYADDDYRTRLAELERRADCEAAE